MRISEEVLDVILVTLLVVFLTSAPLAAIFIHINIEAQETSENQYEIKIGNRYYYADNFQIDDGVVYFCDHSGQEVISPTFVIKINPHWIPPKIISDTESGVENE